MPLAFDIGRKVLIGACGREIKLERLNLGDCNSGGLVLAPVLLIYWPCDWLNHFLSLGLLKFSF